MVPQHLGHRGRTLWKLDKIIQQSSLERHDVHHFKHGVHHRQQFTILTAPSKTRLFFRFSQMSRTGRTVVSSLDMRSNSSRISRWRKIFTTLLNHRIPFHDKYCLTAAPPPTEPVSSLLHCILVLSKPWRLGSSSSKIDLLIPSTTNTGFLSHPCWCCNNRAHTTKLHFPKFLPHIPFPFKSKPSL